jgi:hypothetical protein
MLAMDELVLLYQRYDALASSIDSSRALCTKVLVPIRGALQTQFVAAGRSLIDDAVSQGALNGLVSELIRFSRKFEQVFRRVFGIEDGDGAAAFSVALRRCLNDKNALSEAHDGRQTAKLPQLLAQQCDVIARNNNSSNGGNDVEFERAVDDVLLLFAHVEDKDVFALAFKKLMARRLVCCKCPDLETELAMVSKLKKAQCEGAVCLERMLQDVGMSKTLTKEFAEWRSATSTVQLAVGVSMSVLTQGAWPIDVPCSTALTLPLALVTTMSLFTEFYGTKFSGRKLQFLHQLGSADVVVNYASSACWRGHLCVSVSTTQLCLLALFDVADVDHMTLGDLKKASRLDERSIKTALLGMLKHKFVACSESPWTASTVISLVKNFKSPHKRLALDAPSVDARKSSAAQPVVEAPEVRQSRDFKLQAAIVRTMKAKRTLTYPQLICEATIGVQQWFVPRVADIKRAIEWLFDKEFIIRDPNDQKMILYMS